MQKDSHLVHGLVPIQYKVEGFFFLLSPGQKLDENATFLVTFYHFSSQGLMLMHIHLKYLGIKLLCEEGFSPTFLDFMKTNYS